MNKSVSSEVKQLMSLDKLYRDSDIALILKVWQNHGLELNKSQRLAFGSVPQAQDIVRRRREWGKLYPASPKVLERRYKAFKEHLDDYSKQSFIVRLLRRSGI